MKSPAMLLAAASVHRIGGLLQRAALIIALCALAGAPSAAYAWNWNLGFGKTVSGSGTIKSETRAVSGFSGIALSLDALVEIQQDGAEGVTVETDDNLLPLIETVVEKGTLLIRHAAGNASISPSKLKIVVHAKTIDRLSIAGAGDIQAEALQAQELKASIAGAGDMRIKSLDAGALSVKLAGSGDFSAAGHAASVHASIAGSGDLKAAKLDAKDVELSIAGSGDAIVWARRTLQVNVAGSGDVKYFGDAEVKQSVIGSGSIERLGAAPSGSDPAPLSSTVWMSPQMTPPHSISISP